MDETDKVAGPSRSWVSVDAESIVETDSKMDAGDQVEVESEMDGEEKVDAESRPQPSKAESSGSESESSVELPRRERLVRQAVKNAKPWTFFKRSRKKHVVEETPVSATEDEDLPEDFPRCATCTKALTERTWFQGRYFDHCAR
jgi:histone-lysine N-methyltransferase SUV420H